MNTSPLEGRGQIRDREFGEARCLDSSVCAISLADGDPLIRPFGPPSPLKGRRMRARFSLQRAWCWPGVLQAKQPAGWGAARNCRRSLDRRRRAGLRRNQRRTCTRRCRCARQRWPAADRGRSVRSWDVAQAWPVKPSMALRRASAKAAKRSLTAATVSGDAVSGRPELNGGAGAYSIIS